MPERRAAATTTDERVAEEEQRRATLAAVADAEAPPRSPAGLVARPMSEATCSCPWTDPSTWTVYGSAVEPGSQRELDPSCPVHGDA